jgi:hypothetical protein
MGSDHRHTDDVTTAATRPLTGDAAIRAAQNTRPEPDFESTAFAEPPPLSEAVVAIVTTGGLHHADDQGWDPGTPISLFARPRGPVLEDYPEIIEWLSSSWLSA